MDPKNTIRLISLEPSKRHEVKFTLFEVGLGYANLDYDALSYSWESFNGIADVLCEGGIWSVTKNCYAALCRLKPSSSRQVARKLWIDAICINQQNLDEKNEQIKLMRLIYSNARRVIVWLGNDADNGALFLRSMKAYVGHYEHFSPPKDGDEAVPYNTTPWVEGMERTRAVLFDKSKTRAVEACSVLLQRSWFKRTWILQEVVLGKEVHMVCGSQTMPFLDLFRCIINRRTTRNIEPALLEPLQVMHTLRTIHNSRLPQSPSLILRLSKQFLVTDPKDKVFGLCGLSERLERVLERVSYRDEIATIYMEAALQCLHTEQNTVFLVLAGNASIPTLPSWVPDFNHKGSTFWDLYTRRRQRTSDRVVSAAWAEGRSLACPGWFIDTVKECHAPTTSKTASSITDMIEQWTKWKEFAKPTRLGTIENSILRFIELLGWQLDDAHRFAIDSPRDSFAQWLVLSFTLNRGASTDSDPEASIDSDPEASTDSDPDFDSSKYVKFKKGIEGNAIFKTPLGNCGLAPEAAQSGDQIVIIPGCMIPFVVRKSNNTFRFIGACYLSHPYVVPAGGVASDTDLENWEPQQERVSTYGLESLSASPEHHFTWNEALPTSIELT